MASFITLLALNRVDKHISILALNYMSLTIHIPTRSTWVEFYLGHLGNKVYPVTDWVKGTIWSIYHQQEGTYTNMKTLRHALYMYWQVLFIGIAHTIVQRRALYSCHKCNSHLQHSSNCFLTKNTQYRNRGMKRTWDHAPQLCHGSTVNTEGVHYNDS